MVSRNGRKLYTFRNKNIRLEYNLNAFMRAQPSLQSQKFSFWKGNTLAGEKESNYIPLFKDPTPQIKAKS